METTLSQTDPAHNLTPCYYKMYYNTALNQSNANNKNE
jgi:hypothetical protein